MKSLQSVGVEVKWMKGCMHIVICFTLFDVMWCAVGVYVIWLDGGVVFGIWFNPFVSAPVVHQLNRLLSCVYILGCFIVVWFRHQEWSSLLFLRRSEHFFNLKICHFCYVSQVFKTLFLKSSFTKINAFFSNLTKISLCHIFKIRT